MSRIGKSIDKGCKFVIVQCRGWEWGATANKHEVSFWGVGTILKLDCGYGCTALN